MGRKNVEIQVDSLCVGTKKKGKVGFENSDEQPHKNNSCLPFTDLMMKKTCKTVQITTILMLLYLVCNNKGIIIETGLFDAEETADIWVKAMKYYYISHLLYPENPDSLT